MAISERGSLWLAERGLDQEIASRYGVESFETPSGEAIGFSYMLDGEHVNTKFRALGDKRFWMSEGGTLCFWNANTLADRTLAEHSSLVITEGECDALAAIQCGFPHVVSVPNGAPPSDAGEARYAWLDQHLASVTHKSVVLATDDDGPGRRLCRDLIARIGRERCQWAKYPKGCKDLNQVLLEHGPEAVVRCLSSATWCKIDGLYTVDTLPPEPDHDIMETGMPGLDALYKIRVGELTVVSGTPNSGKTEWVQALACSMADKHNLRVVLASFEDLPRTTMLPRLSKWKSGNRNLSADSEDWLREHFQFVVPDHDGEEAPDLIWLIQRIKAAVIRHEARLVVIDPWNEIEHIRPPEMTVTEYIGEAIRRLKAFARNYDVHIIVVAHPAKGITQKIREGHGLSLYDISDSAHWANKPDCGVIIERDFDTDIATVHVKKIRHQPIIGKVGQCHMSLNAVNGRFESAPAPAEIK